MTDADRGALSGRVLGGRIELEALLGRGGMGEVYRAQHHELAKRVAVKVMSSAVNTTKVDLKRFEREAKTAARLDHPGCVRVLDAGEDEGLLYLVMEYVAGESLEKLLEREGAIPMERACGLMLEVLAGIGAAHQLGIVHRDIKPANILIAQGHARVCDFGIAKITGGADMDMQTRAKLTTQGAIIGTPAYMSPEQAMGHEVGPKSDLYAAGVVLYEMIAGRPPFLGKSAMAILIQHLRELPPHLSQFVPNVPRALDNLLMRALEKDPRARFASAEELARAIEAFLSAPATELAIKPREVSNGRGRGPSANPFSAMKPTAPELGAGPSRVSPEANVAPTSPAIAPLPMPKTPAKWVPPEQQVGGISGVVYLSIGAAVLILAGAAFFGGKKSVSSDPVTRKAERFFDRAPAPSNPADLEWYLFQNLAASRDDRGRELWKKVMPARRDALFPNAPAAAVNLPARWAADGGYIQRLELSKTDDDGFIKGTMYHGYRNTMAEPVTGVLDGNFALLSTGEAGVVASHHWAVLLTDGGARVGQVQLRSPSAFWMPEAQMALADENWRRIGTLPPRDAAEDEVRELKLAFDRETVQGLFYFTTTEWSSGSRAYTVAAEGMKTLTDYKNQVDTNLSLSMPGKWVSADGTGPALSVELISTGGNAVTGSIDLMVQTNYSWDPSKAKMERRHFVVQGARDDHAVVFGCKGRYAFWFAFPASANQLQVVEMDASKRIINASTLVRRE